MNKEKIEFITEDHATMIEIAGEFGSEYREDMPADVPESCYAQYLNHLLDQTRLCWEIIRNREAKI